MNRLTRHGFDGLGGLLLIAGTAVFSAGGRSHPPVGTGLGEIGSEAFYRAFATEVVSHDGWVGIHALLLFGPVLWVLGLVALAGARWRSGEPRWSSLGLLASAIGVVFWVVTFILDGFVSPVVAGTLLDAGPALAPAYVMDFAIVQNVVIRAGLVSWLLIGLGMAAFGISLLSARHGVLFSRLLAASGLLLGLWPLVAWAQGTFDPGPFTSPLWNATAVLTSGWFLLAGVWVLTNMRDPVDHSVPADAATADRSSPNASTRRSAWRRSRKAGRL